MLKLGIRQHGEESQGSIPNGERGNGRGVSNTSTHYSLLPMHSTLAIIQGHISENKAINQLQEDMGSGTQAPTWEFNEGKIQVAAVYNLKEQLAQVAGKKRAQRGRPL